jgi:hypothetical protein
MDHVDCRLNGQAAMILDHQADVWTNRLPDGCYQFDG